MKALRHFWWLYRREVLVTLALLLASSTWFIVKAYAGTPEIMLAIGEPYEQMRKQSSAKIASALPDVHWYSQIDEPAAILRFIDPQFGFVTPPAKFLTVSYNQGKIEGVRMSPQVDTLTLDEALKVVLNLQEQLRQGGWFLVRMDHPAYRDTPEIRLEIRDGKAWQSFWNAEKKYGVSLFIQRFQDDKRPNEERYLIHLDIGRAR